MCQAITAALVTLPFTPMGASQTVGTAKGGKIWRGGGHGGNKWAGSSGQSKGELENHRTKLN